MNKKKWSFILIVFCCSFSHVVGYASDATAAKAEESLQINLPVKIQKGNAVFNVGQVALLGTMPIALAHINILSNDFKAQNVKGEIIAIFHTEAGYIALNDNTYNEYRHVNTGNPYKELIVNLMNRGVQFELCGATAKAHRWVNTDLISGLKVNTDAMIRLTQLGQEGFVIITE